jgi:hypothetical protein
MSVIDLTSDDDEDKDLDIFLQTLPAAKRRKIEEAPPVPAKPQDNPFNNFKLAAKKSGDDGGWIQTRGGSDFGFDDLKENPKPSQGKATASQTQKRVETMAKKSGKPVEAVPNAPQASITLGPVRFFPISCFRMLI